MVKSQIHKEKLVQISIQLIANSDYQVDKIKYKNNLLICNHIKLISCKYILKIY